jgi:hypothetical protein
LGIESNEIVRRRNRGDTLISQNFFNDFQNEKDMSLKLKQAKFTIKAKSRFLQNLTRRHQELTKNPETQNLLEALKMMDMD